MEVTDPYNCWWHNAPYGTRWQYSDEQQPSPGTDGRSVLVWIAGEQGDQLKYIFYTMV